MLAMIVVHSSSSMGPPYPSTVYALDVNRTPQRRSRRKRRIPDAPPAFPSIGHIQPQQELASAEPQEPVAGPAPPSVSRALVVATASIVVGTVLLLAGVGAVTVGYVLFLM